MNNYIVYVVRGRILDVEGIDEPLQLLGCMLVVTHAAFPQKPARHLAGTSPTCLAKQKSSGGGASSGMATHNPFIRKGGKAGLDDGSRNDGLQETEYWTAQVAPTSSDSWWSQSNWFRSTTATSNSDQQAQKSSISETVAAPGTATVFNRFVVEKTVPANTIVQELAEQKTRKFSVKGVGGLRRKELQRVYQLMVLPLEYPEVFQTIGVKPASGIVLSGPSGVGKSLIVEGVVSSLPTVYYQKVDGVSMLSQKDGVKNLKSMFKTAAEQAPAILFIDQVDMIASSEDRSESASVSLLRETLKSEMDKLKAHKSKKGFVVVVAATCNPQKLDPSLMRNGRFSRSIVIKTPDTQGRVHLLRVVTRDCCLGKDVDLNEVAANTHGFVGSDLRGLCTEAALMCVREQFVKSGIDICKPESGDMELIGRPELLKEVEICQRHFMKAIETIRPSSLRDTEGARENADWSSIGGQVRGECLAGEYVFVIHHTTAL